MILPNLQKGKDQAILALKTEQQRLIEKYSLSSDETKDGWEQQSARVRANAIAIHNIPLLN